MKEELHELIEGYLNSTLSDTELKTVESRLESDADFRKEVELHRAMHNSLGNMGKHQLRAALSRLLLDPPVVDMDSPNEIKPAPSTIPKWLVWLVVLLFSALVSLLLWRWMESKPEVPSNIPIESAPPDTLSPVKPLDTESVPEKAKTNREIAMVDPKDFAPNPVLEARIGDMVRGGNTTFELKSPTSGTTYPLKNGAITLTVKGILSGNEPPADHPLALLVYSNRPEDWTQNKPASIISMPFKKNREEGFDVDFRPKIRLHPGLYYLVIGQKRLPEVGDGYSPLWIDKILVREN